MKLAKISLLTALLACVFLCSARGEDIVQMLPLHTQPGVTAAEARTVDFALTTDAADPVWGYQLDILLPTGVQFDDSAGSPFTLVSGRYPESPMGHHIDYAQLPSGWWRIIVTPDDDTRLTSRTHLALQARYTTVGGLSGGLYPVRVRSSVIATSGTEGVTPMKSASYVSVGDDVRLTAPHIDLSDVDGGQLPSFVVDSLSTLVTLNSRLTQIDIRNIDHLGHPLQTSQRNTLVVAKAGTPHATARNTIAWTPGATSTCSRLVLDEVGGPFEAPLNFAADSVFVVRELSSANWYTLCLPFSLDSEQIAQWLGEGARLAGFKGIETEDDKDVLVFERQDVANLNIEAHQPYLVRLAEDADTLRLGSLGIFADGAQETVSDDFAFVGTYDGGVPVPAGCYYISGNVFYKSLGMSKQRPFRGYFRDDRSQALGAKKLLFSFWDSDDEEEAENTGDEQTTEEIEDQFQKAGTGTITLVDEKQKGLVNLEEYTELKQDEDETTSINGTAVRITTAQPVYTLSGQRVLHPRRGIYIRQGRKIIIR